MANRTLKGFRLHKPKNGAEHGSYETVRVASAYGSAIYEGFPVKRVDGGYYEVAAAGDSFYGVVVSIDQFKDSDGRVRQALGASPKLLPASTTYSGIDDESRLVVAPARNWYFEVDADDGVSATTRAAFIALIGSNGDHVISSDDAALDISDVVTKDGAPGSAQWRVVDISPRLDQDFASSRVKLIVEAVEVQGPEYEATGL